MVCLVDLAREPPSSHATGGDGSQSAVSGKTMATTSTRVSSKNAIKKPGMNDQVRTLHPVIESQKGEKRARAAARRRDKRNNSVERVIY